MDRFKFRAWDTKQNKMWSAEEMGKDELTLSVNGRGFVNINSFDTRLSSYAINLIPLQCTGKKDENGILIYEGDIGKDEDGYENFKVVWDDDDASFRLEQGNVSNEFNKYFEVIGNIYETPELLEVR